VEPKFRSELECKEGEEGIWCLVLPLIYDSGILDKTITVPEGFCTDFASVPRVPFVFEAFGDRAHRESVIHDFLYQTAMVERSVADRVFLEAMKVRGKKPWIRWCMFLGVRLGGWKAWNDHREKEKQR